MHFIIYRYILFIQVNKGCVWHIIRLTLFLGKYCLQVSGANSIASHSFQGRLVIILLGTINRLSYRITCTLFWNSLLKKAPKIKWFQTLTLQTLNVRTFFCTYILECSNIMPTHWAKEIILRGNIDQYLKARFQLNLLRYFPWCLLC